MADNPNPTSRTQDSLGFAALAWCFAGLIGMILAVTVAINAPLPELHPALSAMIAVGCGWASMLAFGPWKRMATIGRRRREMTRLTEKLKRINAGNREQPVQDLVTPGDDELARLSRGIRDALLQASRDRRESRRLQRNMDDVIRKETGKATVKLRREASTDPLTGIGNRREMDQRIEELFGPERRRRHDSVVAMFIDLDRFKPVNDTLGHEVGDQCLAFLGELLASTVRREDCPVRLGGDEFAVIMPNQTIDEAQVLAKRISSLFRQMPWPHRPLDPPTLSIGIASVWTGDTGGAEALLRRADAALYDSKHSGRNMVTVFDGHRHVA